MCHDFLLLPWALKLLMTFALTCCCLMQATWQIGPMLLAASNKLWHCWWLCPNMLVLNSGNMADWAQAFGCKVHIPVADTQWVTEPGDYVNLWSGTWHTTGKHACFWWCQMWKPKPIPKVLLLVITWLLSFSCLLMLTNEFWCIGVVEAFYTWHHIVWGLYSQIVHHMCMTDGDLLMFLKCRGCLKICCLHVCSCMGTRCSCYQDRQLRHTIW